MKINYMSNIKLIEKNTNISELKMSKMPWDVEINGVPYQVVRIEGYVHSVGGRCGENNLWMYPRNSNPTYETLIEYQCAGCGGFYKGSPDTCPICGGGIPKV